MNKWRTSRRLEQILIWNCVVMYDKNNCVIRRKLMKIAETESKWATRELVQNPMYFLMNVHPGQFGFFQGHNYCASLTSLDKCHLFCQCYLSCRLSTIMSPNLYHLSPNFTMNTTYNNTELNPSSISCQLSMPPTFWKSLYRVSIQEPFEHKKSTIPLDHCLQMY